MDKDNSCDYPPSLIPKDYDWDRATVGVGAKKRGAEWSYMLSPRQEGEVHFNTCGKQLVISAGHVSLILLTR